MLKVLQAGAGRPISYPLDPNATFQPGMIAQMKSIGNDAVIGVSDGRAPCGIIDDIKDTAFMKPVIDEIVIIEPGSITTDGYNYFAGTVGQALLKKANIVENSLTSSKAGIELKNSVNGVVALKTGAQLNYKTPGSPTFNAFRTLVRYSYFVPNIPGEDTTLGSGRVTLWFTRGIFQTDQYELVPYGINANLYVSANGKLTSEQTIPNQPAVAMCLIPPSSHNAVLELLWW
jgi:hypothetical protein